MVVLTISLLELVSIGTVATCDASPTVSKVLPVTTDVFEEITFVLDLSLDVSELECVEIEGVDVFVTVVSVSVLIIVPASTTELPPVVSVPVLIMVLAATTEVPPVVSVLTSDETEFVDDSDWILVSLPVVSLPVCTLPVETEVIEDSDDCACEFD